MKSSYYMLDTNMVSFVIKGNPISVRDKLITIPMEDVCISAITEAELLHGVAKKPEAKNLALAVNEFLLRVEVLPWNSVVANSYAHFRASCEKQGKALSAMDMLIAAHAISVNAILVTNDQAFYQLEHLLELEDWC